MLSPSDSLSSDHCSCTQRHSSVYSSGANQCSQDGSSPPPLASDRTDVFFNHLHIFFNLLGSTQESVTGAGSIPLHLYPFGKCGQLEYHLACDVDEQREEF